MSVVTPYKAIDAVSKSSDPRQTIKEMAGDLTNYRLRGDLVLIGVYMRSEKIGSIIRPDSNKAEDMFQGKVGLILKLGPDAFRSPETGELYEQNFKVDEWVQYWVGDARQTQIHRMPCRIIRDTLIVAALPHDEPEMVL